MNYSKIAIQIQEDNKKVVKTLRVPKGTKARVFLTILKRRYHSFILLASSRSMLIEA
jgi:hypothetical protein